MIRRHLRSFAVAAAALAAAAIPARSVLVARTEPQARPPAAAVVAIRNATIVTVTHGTIQNGTILMRDGKIAAVGTNVQIPSGADVVDGTGKFVSPGIIDAHSHIANDAINEGATAVSSMVGMGDVLNPTDIAIQRDLAGGLTVANILHGSANPICRHLRGTGEGKTATTKTATTKTASAKTATTKTATTKTATTKTASAKTTATDSTDQDYEQQTLENQAAKRATATDSTESRL